jgi:RNA-directed DNA polymerase
MLEERQGGMIKPTISLQELRTRIANRAKSAPTHRFWGLFVHIAKLETLEAAYLGAKRNGGAPGEDGITFEQIESAGRREFLRAIASELHEDRYRPLPYRRREIPKGGGRVRVISIPSIRDRVVQGAIRLILEPIFEADFSDSSYGARPGRSAHQAVERVRHSLHQRKHYVADIDLAGFFDNIRQDRMLRKVARRVEDAKVLAMLKLFLKGNGKRGIPQGSPLSPLLANVALNDLDQAMDRGQGFLTYVRYLDDIVVLAPNSSCGKRWGHRALARIAEEAKEIGVEINTEKSRVVDMAEPKAQFAFLGFAFRWQSSRRTKRKFACMVPRIQAVTSVLRQVRSTLNRSRQLPTREAVTRVNRVLRGWVNYFRVGNSAAAFQKVREMVERRVRRFVARRGKRGGFGWKRWSSEVVYGVWGLFNEYRIVYASSAKVAPFRRNHNPG